MTNKQWRTLNDLVIENVIPTSSSRRNLFYICLEPPPAGWETLPRGQRPFFNNPPTLPLMRGPLSHPRKPDSKDISGRFLPAPKPQCHSDKFVKLVICFQCSVFSFQFSVLDIGHCSLSIEKTFPGVGNPGKVGGWHDQYPLFEWSESKSPGTTPAASENLRGFRKLEGLAEFRDAVWNNGICHVQPHLGLGWFHGPSNPHLVRWGYSWLNPFGVWCHDVTMWSRFSNPELVISSP